MLISRQFWVLGGTEERLEMEGHVGVLVLPFLRNATEASILSVVLAPTQWAHHTRTPSQRMLSLPTSSGLRNCPFLCVLATWAASGGYPFLWISGWFHCSLIGFPDALTIEYQFLILNSLYLNFQHDFFLPGWLVAGAVPSKYLLWSWKLLRDVYDQAVHVLPPWSPVMTACCAAAFDVTRLVIQLGATVPAENCHCCCQYQPWREGWKMLLFCSSCDMNLSVFQSRAQFWMKFSIEV